MVVDPFFSVTLGFFAEVLAALVAGHFVGGVVDSGALVIHFGIDEAQVSSVLLGEHGGVDGLGESGRETGIARVGGGLGKELEGFGEAGTGVSTSAQAGEALGRKEVEDLVDISAVLLGCFAVFGGLVEVFLEAGFDDAAVSERNGDSGNGDGFGGRVEEGDFLSKGGFAFFLLGSGCGIGGSGRRGLGLGRSVDTLRTEGKTEGE